MKLHQARGIYEQNQRILLQRPRSYSVYQGLQSKQDEMIYIHRANIYKIYDYSQHLKGLTMEDKVSRFGHPATDYSIDQMILSMCYNPTEHELWYARTEDQRVGWGHLAKNNDNSWELAVSVQHDYQRQGIGNQLIQEMLAFAKFHGIHEVYMHCIEDNRVIQHLARKNELETKERGDGERTAAIEVPEPSFLETNTQLWKEQKEIFNEFGKLRNRLTHLWATPILPK
jgi:GNAT superfamily N-acetyltransferase